MDVVTPTTRVTTPTNISLNYNYNQSLSHQLLQVLIVTDTDDIIITSQHLLTQILQRGVPTLTFSSGHCRQSPDFQTCRLVLGKSDQLISQKEYRLSFIGVVLEKFKPFYTLLQLLNVVKKYISKIRILTVINHSTSWFYRRL